SSSVVPMDALKEYGRGTVGNGRFGLTGALVVVQVTLSVTLVVAAGLFGRSFTFLVTRHPGFERDPVLLVESGRGTHRRRAGTASRAVRAHFATACTHFQV